jgi:hypothetical protein
MLIEQTPAGDPPVEEIHDDALEAPSAADVANDPDVVAAFDRAEALGESDSDAPPADGSADSTEQPAAGGETTSSDSTPAPSSSTPAAPWFNDQDIAAAEARGLSAYDLYEFGNAAEFRKAINVIDRAALNSRQSAPAPSQAPAANTATPPAPLDESAIDAPTLPDGRVNVSYFEKNYDEGMAAAMRAVRAQQDRDLQREAQAEQSAKAAKDAEAQRRVDTFLDELDRDETGLYGKSLDEHGNPVTLDQQAYDRRLKTWNFVGFLKNQMAQEQQAKNLPVALPPDAYFIKQATSTLYAAELIKREQDQRQAKQRGDVLAQSRTIRPAAGSTGAGYARKAPTNKADHPHVLASDPDVAAMFAKAGIS